MQGNHDAGPSRLGGVYSMFGAAASSQLSETTSYPTDPSTSTSGFDWELEDSSRALDLVFIMDATGSMGSYIASATKNIEAICDNIIQSERLRGPGALRVGLIAYRDHPPQDHTYVTKTVPLNSDIQVTKDFLKKLYASGGGDGPEAVTAAMAEVLRMDWRPNATKMTVLIADAPPHGIGEYGDGFPNGSPDGNDPLVIAKAMAAAGIPLFMVACEPALSGYANAADFFQGLVKITGALLVPLTTASLLSHVIIAAAGEAMDLERLHREVGDAVADRLRSLSLDGSSNSELDMDQVARQLHQTLLGRNENTKQLHVENIYRESEESKHNIEVWSQAPDVEHAKPFIKKVIGSRLSDKYLSTRSTSSSYKPFTPYPHPRGGTSTSSDLYGSTTTTTITPSTSTSNSSGSSGTSPNPSPSGSRRVISDFSAFSASPGLSISPSSRNNPNPNSTSNSFSSSTPSKLSASFRERSAMRGMEDDDEEDEDMAGGKDDWSNDGDGKPLPAANMNADGELVVAGDDGQQLNYKQGVISLDQARRLAQLSASRRT